MKRINKSIRFLIALISLLFPTLVHSSESSAGVSGGLTLISPTSARSSALGEAFTASEDDIAGLGYNPATLSSLKLGQGSFLFQKGALEDSYGHFLLGSPTKMGGMGLSVGYYNGGTFDIVDQPNGTPRSVNVQTDLTVAMGYARKLGGVSVGITGKYLSSKLIEQYSASAFAADFGLQIPVHSRLSIGAAVQNIGTQLKFINEGDDLPRIARAGLSYGLFSGVNPTTLFLDVPYYLNEQEAIPALGVESRFGPLAIRGGYRIGQENNEFSVGTGFLVGRTSIDYAFGLVKELESQHKISVSMRFGSGLAGPAFVKQMERPVQMIAKPVKVEEPEVTAEAPAAEEPAVEETASAQAVEQSIEPEAVEAPVAQVQKEEPVKAAAAAKERKAKEKMVRIKESEVMTVPAPRYSLGSYDNKKTKARKATRNVYIVKSDDTLSSIAEKYYGNENLWAKIYAANRHLIEDPSTLEEGQKLILP